MPKAIPIEKVRDQLLTLDQVRARFRETEPLDGVTFDLHGPGHAKWTIDPEWQMVDVKEKGKTIPTPIAKAPGLAPVKATVTVDGTDYGLTKDALLEATSLIGITKQYAMKSPSHLLQPHLRYWYQNEGGVQGNTLRMLSSKGTVYAFTKASIDPFSNLRILDAIETSAKKAFGGHPELFVDYKFHHDLRRTGARVIIPNVVHDVRDGDPWSAGVAFRQSIVGEKPLVLNGYLFRYWCTNGAITTHLESGNYNRRSQGQGDEVYDWVAESVDAILGGFEHEFEILDELAKTRIPRIGKNETESRSLALMDAFETYSLPLEQREHVIDLLVDSDDFTMYGIMQAITEAANREGLRDTISERLMRIGGDLPRANSNRCSKCRRLPV